MEIYDEIRKLITRGEFLNLYRKIRRLKMFQESINLEKK